MEVHGRIAGSSNATLLVTCRLGPDELLAVVRLYRALGGGWEATPEQRPASTTGARAY